MDRSSPQKHTDAPKLIFGKDDSLKLVYHVKVPPSNIPEGQEQIEVQVITLLDRPVLDKDEYTLKPHHYGTVNKIEGILSLFLDEFRRRIEHG